MSVIYDPQKQPNWDEQPVAPRPARKRPGRRPMLKPRLSRPRFGRQAGWWVLGLVVAGGVWLAATHVIWQPGGNPSETATLPANIELIDLSRTYLSQADAAARRPLNLSLNALKSWRTLRIQPAPGQMLDSRDYLISCFALAADSTNLEPTGYLTIENINQWLGSGNAGGTSGYVGLATAGSRQAYIHYLSGLIPGATPASQNIPLVSGETGARAGLVRLSSSDSKLYGVIYTASVNSGSGTAPHVIADMAGVIDGQTVYAHLNITASSDSVGQLADQGKALMESLTFDTSQRDAQAPAISQ